MSIAKYFKNIPKMFGPSGGEIVTCKFSVATTTLTTLEAQGCTVARTGTGVYTITLGRTPKMAIVNLTIQRAAGAQTQSVWVTAQSGSTITITQFTAADGTPVDTLSFTAHVTVHLRQNAN